MGLPLKIVLGITLSVAILYAAIRVYPTPLEWLLSSPDPAIMDYHEVEPGAFEGNILPAVLRHHPNVANERGLLTELVREGFKIDRIHRSAEIHWSSTHCENWLSLDWTVGSDGSVLLLHKDWQAGCG
jgi:hypothetical protein